MNSLKVQIWIQIAKAKEKRNVSYINEQILLMVDDQMLSLGMNSVTLLGRVGGDPQLRGTSGQALTFSLATNERWLNKNTDVWEERVSWHNIAVFKDGLRQSIYDNVGKGHRVLVQGKLNYGQIEDQAGIVRKTTTIIADDVIRLGSPVGGGRGY